MDYSIKKFNERKQVCLSRSYCKTQDTVPLEPVFRAEYEIGRWQIVPLFPGPIKGGADRTAHCLPALTPTHPPNNYKDTKP
jgi:hypothetical protein